MCTHAHGAHMHRKTPTHKRTHRKANTHKSFTQRQRNTNNNTHEKPHNHSLAEVGARSTCKNEIYTTSLQKCTHIQHNTNTSIAMSQERQKTLHEKSTKKQMHRHILQHDKHHDMNRPHPLSFTQRHETNRILLIPQARYPPCFLHAILPP